jgi:hypothetical protein
LPKNSLIFSLIFGKYFLPFATPVINPNTTKPGVLLKLKGITEAGADMLPLTASPLKLLVKSKLTVPPDVVRSDPKPRDNRSAPKSKSMALIPLPPGVIAGFGGPGGVKLPSIKLLAPTFFVI